MLLYRIGSLHYRLDDPTGAALWPGRWNVTGQRVLYAATTFGGAILEQLAHAAIGKLPPRRWCTITVPESCPVERRRAERLPRGWDDPADYAVARAVGAAWFDAGKTCVLLVPAVTAQPVEWNAVINTNHPAFATLRFGAARVLRWDSRLG